VRVALLPPLDPRRFDLLGALGSALEHGGRLEEAQVLLAEAAREAANAGDRRAEMRLRIELALVRFGQAEAAAPDELEPLVDEAVSVFEEFGDDVGLAATWTLSAFESWAALRWQEMSEKMERAIAHARRAGNQAAINRCFGWLTPSYIFGPTPVAEAIARIEEIRAESEPGSLGEATTLTALGWLEAMRGDVEKGRALYRQGSEQLIELGALVRRAGRSMVGAEIEFLGGDPAAAEAELREGFRLLDEIGEKALLSTLAFNLGEALYLQGRWEEAEQFTRVSEDLAPPDDIASQVGWRAVRAKILARRAELEQAERLSTEALRLIEQTDALSHHADVLVRRAEVLRLAGRTEDAKGALEEGIRLYETKGILPAVERTRALLSELTG
jgi:tetratricopeptide (TPR) repeat protein